MQGRPGFDATLRGSFHASSIDPGQVVENKFLQRSPTEVWGRAAHAACPLPIQNTFISFKGRPIIHRNAWTLQEKITDDSWRQYCASAFRPQQMAPPATYGPAYQQQTQYPNHPLYLPMGSIFKGTSTDFTPTTTGSTSFQHEKDLKSCNAFLSKDNSLSQKFAAAHQRSSSFEIIRPSAEANTSGRYPLKEGSGWTSSFGQRGTSVEMSNRRANRHRIEIVDISSKASHADDVSRNEDDSEGHDEFAHLHCRVELTADLLAMIPLGANGELSSAGSIAHASGTCKPCVFCFNEKKADAEMELRAHIVI